MCELVAAAASEPFALDELWDLAATMERFGVAGFGWGVAWRTGEGRIDGHLSTAALRDDPERSRLDGVRTTAAMIHLRRPSKLSTLGLPDAQPFLDPAGRFAFSHNGDLAAFRPARRRYQAEGRIAGRADSEVGQRWLEDRWSADATDACDTLAQLHGELGGQANLMALAPGGVTHVYAGNTENPVFRFRLGGLHIVATALYSIDRSLFRLAAPTATDRHLLRPGERFDLAPGA